jgi:hypothetical protein
VWGLPHLILVVGQVEECYAHPESDVNERLEIRIEDVIIFLQTHKKCTPYFQNLSSAFGAGDSSDLFKIEANLLRELAELDSKLGVLRKEEEQADQDLYFRERGGDAAACVVPGVPGLEEVQISCDPGKGSPPEVPNGGPQSAIAADLDRDTEPGEDPAMVQRLRRVKRAMERRFDSRGSADLKESNCFAQHYRRVDAVDGTGGQVSRMQLEAEPRGFLIPND